MADRVRMIPFDAATAAASFRKAAARQRGRADDLTRIEVAQHSGKEVAVQKPEAVIAARTATLFEAIAQEFEKAGGAP